MLYGQHPADPDLMRICLNIVRHLAGKEEAERVFHCTLDDEYIVLLDQEARSMLFGATGEAGRSLVYNMKDFDGSSRTANKNYEEIIRHLAALKANDPEAFRKRFIFRSCWGHDGIVAFLVLADGHRRLFSYFDSPEIEGLDRASSDPALSTDYRPPDHITVSLLSKSGLLGRKRTVIAEITILSSDVEHVFGTTHHFVLMTKTQKLKFTPEGLLVEPRVFGSSDEDDA